METFLPDFPNELNLDSVNWEQVLNRLVELTGFCKTGENRMKLSTANFKLLARLLNILLEENIERDDIFVEAFRFLRNSVVSCARNQNAIREESDLYKVTRCFLHSQCYREQRIQEKQTDGIAGKECEDVDFPNYSEEKLLSVSCSLQFLANSMVDNQENTDKVIFSVMELDDLTRVLNSFHNEKVVQYVAMIVHLALKKHPQSLGISQEMLHYFLQNLHLEFVVYVMESLVLMANLGETYEMITSQSRIKLLDFLNARLDLVKSLDEKTISVIKKNFIERSDYILKSKIDDRDNIFCWEIAILLEVLCSISSTESPALSLDRVLLTTVVYLLKQIYEAGKLKLEGNLFTPVEDLDKLASTSSTPKGTDDIRAHPTFQFKAHLIRLIGNLAHRNTDNQDQVRELECLPIILDSCKIDARNPFIAQWSELAIRNLCEGNMKNQSYIREVQRVDTENRFPKLSLADWTLER